MALVLVLKSVEGLPGKADRVGKATFRGKSLVCVRVYRPKCCMGAYVEPVRRPIQNTYTQ